MSVETEQQLCDELEAWQTAQGLPLQCAFEQMHREELTTEQFHWLQDFNDRWDAMIAATESH